LPYVAGRDLQFSDTDTVCVAGTELELVRDDDLSDEEHSALARRRQRLTDRRLMGFRWLGRVRLLELGTEARMVDTVGPRKLRR
jgi:hypothetical protein